MRFHSGRSFVIIGVAAVLCSGCTMLSRNPPQVNETGDQRFALAPLATLSPEKTNQLQIDTANRLAVKGHAQQAAQLYLLAEKESNGEAVFDVELAPLLAELELFEESVLRYQRAIASQPENIDLKINLAWTLIEAGRHSDSEQQLQQVLAVDPQHKRAYSTLAICKFRSGDKQAAYEAFAAIQGRPAALHNMSLLCIENGDFDSAEHWLKEAMMASPLPETEQLFRAFVEQRS